MNTGRNNIKKLLPDYYSDAEKEEMTNSLIELAELYLKINN
jgi:hypothetical protein